MTTRTRMNVYFDPELLKQVEALSLRRKLSKSAIVEAAVASFLSGDSAEQLEAAMSRRLDKLGRQVDELDEDLAVLGESRTAGRARRRLLRRSAILRLSALEAATRTKPV